jgi:hypothetical protein
MDKEAHASVAGSHGVEESLSGHIVVRGEA